MGKGKSFTILRHQMFMIETIKIKKEKIERKVVLQRFYEA
jgi:hypothetical protein